MGPFGISARLKVWGQRDFDFGVWSTASLNVLSNEELKKSPFGRDIYTLGITLFEAVTGKLPFDGSDVLAHILKSDPEPPRQVDDKIPPGL